MITIFGWVAASSFAVWVIGLACGGVIEYSPLGTLLRPWLLRWFPNERFNRITGKIFAVVVVMGGPLCGLAWLTGSGIRAGPIRAARSNRRTGSA
jgi:hypothetical protein